MSAIRPSIFLKLRCQSAPRLWVISALLDDCSDHKEVCLQAELGGFELAARCIDKCRAALVGWQGDFIYGCPMDRAVFGLGGNRCVKIEAVCCHWCK